MNVLVATNRVPFVHGGAEELCENLLQQLQAHGVAAEAMRIPFTWDPPERLIEEMLISRSLRLANVDRVIALKFPAYLIPHPNKVLWLLHQFRQAYDLYDAGQSHIPPDSRGQQIRSAIREADNIAFGEARRLFVNSPTTAERLARYNGFSSKVLPPPLNDPDLFRGAPSEGYLFAGGRINAGKRHALIIDALRHAPGVRVVIAGPPDIAGDAKRLQEEVESAGVADRVRLDLRFLPREELADIVNRSMAVIYAPFDEDSVGYVTMEAFWASKPVVTLSDSGGVLEIVRHGVTGLVASPNTESLAAAFRQIVRDPKEAAAMGLAGRRYLEAHGLSWDTVIRRLLE